MEMSPLPAPRSLWVENDPNPPAAYIAALWRPNRQVSEAIESNTIHYFHDGDWRDADVPERYAELANPPSVEFGAVSNFLLRISIPGAVLNWNPVLPVKTTVEGNVTVSNVSCRVRNPDTGAVIYDGVLPEEGISIFDVPEGRWVVDCLALETQGRSSRDSAETRVYDVMSLVKVCCGTFAVILILFALLAYRVRRGLRKVRKGVPCPRCGMPLEAGLGVCPVCGKRLKPK